MRPRCRLKVGPAERETVVSGESVRELCVIHGGVILIHCVLLNVLRGMGAAVELSVSRVC